MTMLANSARKPASMGQEALKNLTCSFTAWYGTQEARLQVGFPSLIRSPYQLELDYTDCSAFHEVRNDCCHN